MQDKSVAPCGKAAPEGARRVSLNRGIHFADPIQLAWMVKLIVG
jgi:hypothetical protein